MPGENELDSGSLPDFDMDAAAAEISDGLGFGAADEPPGDGDPLDTDPPAGTPAPPAPAPSPTPAPAPALITPPPGPAAVDLTQPPKTWRPEATADWDKLPENVRAEIYKREEDVFQGIEQYKQGADFGWKVNGLFKPFEQVMAAAGITPLQILPGLVQAHGTLALGSEEQKLGLFEQLVKDYAIPLPKLLAKLTGGALSDTAPFVDPAVAALQEELGAVKSRLSAQDQAAFEARRAENNAKVAAFANDPKNIYFTELADDIALLLERKVVSDLGAAYEKALWANPVVRAKEQARLAAEAESERTRKAAEAAEKAKKSTAANLRSTARSGAVTSPASGSIDETLTKTLAEINARAG